MNKPRIFFDTNVLVYAHDRTSTYHTDSATLLKMAVEQNIQGVLAEQNLIELYRILTNPTAMRGKELTPQQVNSLVRTTYLNGLFQVVYPIPITLDKVLSLATSHNITSARIFDIRLAALILESNIDYFATYNLSDFQSIPDVNPFTPANIIKII
ncbi:type II toxin-antitoxin system VapC family toxin [Roseofilum capinflatum]|uniref:PIN domain-containing protein n=1 Tax=Roseofilum capinflatum BLCC-M114 TaxID=3022440 RepID=A0ABT7B239_9CYAN|nr:PIN domain-containing protein [Roseofilum capinflatum]MDJ1173234.1 PIN domain-containing protein [Roseofilum capinflatum BLCC-M114]